MSFAIPTNQTNQVLGFIFEVNDSVNNRVNSSAMVFVVGSDGTAPTITLNALGNGSNTSSATPNFNFTATDNVDSNFCDVSIDNVKTFLI